MNSLCYVCFWLRRMRFACECELVFLFLPLSIGGIFPEKALRVGMKNRSLDSFLRALTFFMAFRFSRIPFCSLLGKAVFPLQGIEFQNTTSNTCECDFTERKKKTVENRILIRTWGSQRKRMGPWGLILHTNFPPFPPWRRKFILFRRKCKGAVLLSLSLLRWSKANHFQEVV